MYSNFNNLQSDMYSVINPVIDSRKYNYHRAVLTTPRSMQKTVPRSRQPKLDEALFKFLHHRIVLKKLLSKIDLVLLLVLLDRLGRFLLEKHSNLDCGIYLMR